MEGNKMGRKYEEYTIKITYGNGDTEDVKCNGVNTSSYKDMLRLYGDIKEEYINKSVTIDFIGKGSNGELKVFFTKAINNNELSQEVTDTINKVKEMDTSDLLKLIRESLLSIKQKPNHYSMLKGAYSKIADNEYHALESIEKSNKPDNEKDMLRIESAKKIGIARVKRRDAEVQFKLSRNFIDSKYNDDNEINILIDRIDESLKYYNKTTDKEYDILTEDKAKECKMTDKFPYRSEQERIRLVAKYQKLYAHVTYDTKEKMIICYNRSSARDKKRSKLNKAV
jgi:hypothetical protein